jgi:pimeloyl-ACP methyl ester carboxylesterase
MTVYATHDVPVEGGTLRVGVWGDAGPLVVAAHGITSTHQAWALIGPDLGRDHTFVAADLRGRGGSRDLPPPYGIPAHAADIAAVVDAFDGPAILVGHSMGGWVVAETARRRPEIASRLVLVDGGAPLPLPPGIDPAGGDIEIANAIARNIGTAYARLSMTFPDRDAYRQLWRDHPAFADWNEAMTEYADYDLVGTEPELHSSVLLEAAQRDARDLYALDGVRPGGLPVPAVFLRASNGMMDEADRPFYQPGYPSRWLTGVEESTVDGVNHYTIVLGPVGAAAVASAVRGS